MRSFAVDATALGTLSAFYFYSYAPMQLPVGFLMDRFGARRLLTVATVICAAGAFGFMATNLLAIAELSRFFMGFGSAFAFVGMVYISSHWFSGKKLALIVGVGNSIGMLGAVGSEDPLSFLVDNYGWQLTMVILGFFGLLLALVIYLFVRSSPPKPTCSIHQRRCANTARVLKNVKTVLKNRSTWINAFMALFFYAPTVAFAGLWAVPYIAKAYEVSNKVAGFGASMMYVGWIVGGPIIGYFSDKAKKKENR